jgi:hypothetical protein
MGIIKDRFKQKADSMAAEIKDLLKMVPKRLEKYSWHRCTRACGA